MQNLKKKRYPLLAVVLVVLALIFILGQKKSPPLSNLNNGPTPQQIEMNYQSLPPTATASSSAKLLTLRLFFVALEDNGQKGEMVGCGDSIAPVDIQLPETQNPLQSVMTQLLSIKEQTVGPSKLYNSLYQSNLQFKDATIKDGVARINLTGDVKMGGECDNPRFKAQLEKTAGQFSNVNSVQIFINDKPLSDVVSLR